jgi:cytochrome P450
MVVATGPYITECFRLGDKYLDFISGIEDFLPLGHIISISYDKQKRQDDTQLDATKSPLVRTVRNNFKSHQLDLFEKRMEYAVNKGMQLDIHFPAAAKSAKLTINDIAQMVARISGLVFAGEEVGENKELVTAMATYAQSIFKAAIVYMIFPVRVADFFTKRYLDIGKQIAITMKYMTPILARQREQENEKGKSKPTYFMHMMLHTPNADGSEATPEQTAFWLQEVTFASIHTTSLFLTWSLHLLSDRPDVQELVRKETAAAKKKHGALTPSIVKEIPILDSIFREALRLNGDYIGIHHKAAQDTVLSNGTLIPTGTSVGMAVNDAHTDPYIQDIGEDNIPLNEFDPKRHLVRKSKKSTAVGLDLLTFGMGYHACPGRYFASQEICYMLVKILEEYNISPDTKDGKRAQNRLAMVRLRTLRDTPRNPFYLTKLMQYLGFSPATSSCRRSFD